MNAITQTGNTLPAELQNLGAALVQEGQSSAGISDLLKFLAREGGIWVFGQEAVEVEDGSKWAVNPLSFEHGYVCWKDKKIAGEAMVAVGVAKPPRETLEDHGSYTDAKGKEVKCTWDEQMSVRLKCVSGEDKGTEVTYKTSTYGGQQAIKSLAKAIGGRISAGNMDVVAQVELTNDHYNHADHGKTYTPQMEIVGWSNMDGIEVDATTEAPPEASPEAKAEAEAEPEVEEEAKPRRRRSRTR